MASAKPRAGRSLARDEQGAVFAEAVLMLPVVIMLWALVHFVQDGFTQASLAGRNVRAAAWTTAIGRCEDTPAGVSVGSGEAVDAPAVPLAGTMLWAQGRMLRHIPATVLGFMVGGRYRRLVTYAQPERIYGQGGRLERPSYIGGSARYGSEMALRCDEDPPRNWQALRITTAYFADMRRNL
ncbi:MAG: hypothetical protein AAGH15_08330 [Myxococcota bacterium]